jgi:hypothetical protein
LRVIEGACNFGTKSKETIAARSMFCLLETAVNQASRFGQDTETMDLKEKSLK